MRRRSAGPAQSSAVPAHLRRARVGVIRAEYNHEITESLEEKCLQGLQELGISTSQVDCFTVPGCFEIPLLAQRLAVTRRYDVLIALGAVIQGETLHFELVANECARGVMEASLKHGVPVIFEVLAARRRRDALRRAGSDRFNKGFEAAAAAVKILETLAKMGKLSGGSAATLSATSQAARKRLLPFPANRETGNAALQPDRRIKPSTEL